MPKRDPALMRELRSALRQHDMLGMQRVCMRFPTIEQGAAAAEHLIRYELPDVTRRWWFEEICDSDHSPEALHDEALLLLSAHLLDRERETEAPRPGQR